MRLWPPAGANESLILALSPHLPIMTDKESAEGPSLFACGSSHHSGNVVQPAVPRSRLAHERRRVAFFATAWFGQDPAGPGRVAVAPLVFAALGPQLGPPIQLVGHRPLAQALNATGLSVGSRGAGRASFPLRSSGPRCGANCRSRRRRAAPLVNKEAPGKRFEPVRADAECRSMRCPRSGSSAIRSPEREHEVNVEPELARRAIARMVAIS